MDFITIPHSAEGTLITTSHSRVNAEDATIRHIEAVALTSRKDVVQKTIENPYRLLTTGFVDELAGLVNLAANDPKLIDCTGYSELAAYYYMQPASGPMPDSVAIVCIGYMLNAEGTYSPVARVDNGTTFSLYQGYLAAYTISYDDADWMYPTGGAYTVDVSVFDKVAIFITNVTYAGFTKIALCYALA